MSEHSLRTPRSSPASVAPWLRRIVHNRAMDELSRPRMLGLYEASAAQARTAADHRQRSAA
jgi:DNA-directed RNA polymerase specialized sigma24 family protein